MECRATVVEQSSAELGTVRRESVSVLQDPSYERWLEAYGDVYEALPSKAHVACPRCGADALRLEFVGDATDRNAYAAFWCDNCMHGIHISRVSVPPGIRVLPIDEPWESRGEIIPDYRAWPRHKHHQTSRTRGSGTRMDLPLPVRSRSAMARSRAARPIASAAW